MSADAASVTPRRVLATYVTVGSLFITAASLIWAINTIFLMRLGGLTIFQVMIVNASYTVAQMVFEVPTGVVADTIGRKASVLLSLFTIALSTLLYVFTPALGWGIGGFLAASVLLGLGYTFQTGAIDAWLVDALDATGYDRPKDHAFALGQIGFSSGMLVGSLLGGVLGQADLTWPFILRAALLVICFFVALVLMRDLGFESRDLRLSTFGSETRKILRAGASFGWGSPVVRPLLWVSAFNGLFMMYGFYAWQPYVLDLLGKDYVWLLGVVQAGLSLVGIIGNLFVGRLMGEGESRRDPAKVLAVFGWISAVAVFGIALVGWIWAEPGVVPAAVAIVLWLGWGLIFGVSMPVRMAYLNAHIPSSQRATVLSLDAFFNDGGGALGQPALGWVSQRFSYSAAWLIGSLCLAVVPGFYRASGAAVRGETEPAGDTASSEAR